MKFESRSQVIKETGDEDAGSQDLDEEVADKRMSEKQKENSKKDSSLCRVVVVSSARKKPLVHT